jgi:hypothetical protein
MPDGGRGQLRRDQKVHTVGQYKNAAGQNQYKKPVHAIDKGQGGQRLLSRSQEAAWRITYVRNSVHGQRTREGRQLRRPYALSFLLRLALITASISVARSLR